MELRKIISQRGYQKWPSYDLVYEWEDIIASELQLEMFLDSKVRNTIKFIRRLPVSRLLLPSQYSFMFQMNELRFESSNKRNIIPNIVDFYIKDNNRLKTFFKSYSNAPIVLLSSKEAYEYLASIKCPFPVKHLALSISDKYAITGDTVFKKKYDLVLMGRQNPVLEKFLSEYVSKHDDFVYVFRKQIDGKFNYYTSKGDLIGDIATRSQYIDLMRKAKIGLYATPGIDGGELKTNGFNQVTPRFLEYIACGCHIIARYPSNPDTDYYQLSEFCSNVETYEDFEKAMDLALNNTVDMVKYSNYLSKHYTSVRAKQLEEIIKTL